MKVSLVIPAHNEAETVRPLLNQIAAVLRPGTLTYEVIMVDDGSTDATWELIREVAATKQWTQRLRGIRFSRNFGKEAAIVAGLRLAHGEAVVVMDADLQHPPSLLPQMIDIWSRGSYPIVEAVKRRRQEESALRRLSARLFYRLMILGAALDLRDSTDFKLLDKHVVDAYLALPETARFFRGLTAWMGLPTAQLEIDVPDRARGASSWRLGALVAMARRNLVSFTALPLRLIPWIGAGGLLLAVGMTLQTLLNRWLGASEAGFPTVIILLLCLGSLILISLGIIGEYLSAIYTEIKRRPAYVVRDEWPPHSGAD